MTACADLYFFELELQEIRHTNEKITTTSLINFMVLGAFNMKTTQ
jgi:hypothetical protein